MVSHIYLPIYVTVQLTWGEVQLEFGSVLGQLLVEDEEIILM